ncbi:o-succinylbenzoate synthase [Tellurirhabdus bombi]|uniref:o-succinylbenzoate synthase n=1 Tax=Tellurirhabdus bombi TaxID=2907205 RepID=UPI001F45D0C0|nr:o-succinylbenzoate synthase [Tellurirhabdus bombi]
MGLKADFLKHTLQFNFEAGTSRGVLTEKDTYIIRIRNHESPLVYGLGECGPLKGLSIDDRPDFEDYLRNICETFNELDLQLFKWNIPIVLSQLISNQFPSIQFGFETAMLDYINGGRRVVVENDFSKGTRSIPINGLVWMGNRDFMLRQINEKLNAGYNTIKLKIGAIDFAQECELLAYLRTNAPEQLVIRVDANGAFQPDEALDKLTQLAKYGIHSIEQPIRQGQHELMAELCRQTPIPIALDEELIGHMEYVDKFRLLKKLQPQFIILKPSLLGGMHHCDEWIETANRLGIGWWITSALESNIGLNAIAQYTARFPNPLPQGLGTGQLYQNNISSPLTIEHGFLRYNTSSDWDLQVLLDAKETVKNVIPSPDKAGG